MPSDAYKDFQVPRPSRETMLARESMLVLVVLNSQTTCHQLRQVLLTMGFKHITVVNTHYLGLARLRERDYGMVFFDAQPSNMSPVEFVKTARQLDDKSILLAVSGEPRVDDVFSLLREGARHYLVIPFTVDSVEYVLLSAQEGPALSQAVLQAPDRNTALAGVVINSLDQLATAMRQERNLMLARNELADHKKQFLDALELGHVFCEGNVSKLADRIIEACISRAQMSSTKLGRTRQRLAKKRAERLGIEPVVRSHSFSDNENVERINDAFVVGEQPEAEAIGPEEEEES